MVKNLFQGYNIYKQKTVIVKTKRHEKIMKDFEKKKNRHIENLATAMLKNDEKMSKLKEKQIDPKFLNLF